MSFRDFAVLDADVNGVTIHARVFRHRDVAAPVILLVHGFPQTHFIWAGIAESLAEDYSVVCPDLRGYGDSSKPVGNDDHSNYSKAVMAADLVALMDVLGFGAFTLVGHDRGARVSHRLAVDYPHRVTRLCLIDVSPTLTMYEKTSMPFAQAYFHWFFLIQPAPFPERMIEPNARMVLSTFLGGWGSFGLSNFTPEALGEYERCWCTPEAIHASCEDYRASAGIDLVHDRGSERDGVLIECPTFLVWGENGVIGKLFSPIEDWTKKARGPVTGRAISAGHYIPDEAPELLLRELRAFLSS